MSESVNLPALGESVTEGTVTRWLKNVGDRVEVDEPLVEVSTDKVDTEIPSPIAGIIEAILVAEDETVDVGTALVTIGDGTGAAEAAPAAPAAETVAEPASAPAAPTTAAVVPAAPVPAPVEAAPAAEPQPVEPEPAPQPVAPESAPAPAPALTPVPAPAPAQQHAPAHAGQGYVTPLVRKLANEKGVDLASVSGSGIGGRIRKQDVLAAQTLSGAAPAQPLQTSPLRGTAVPMSRLRKVMAERAVVSMQTSAQLTAVVEVEVTAIAELRDSVQDQFQAKAGVKLNFLPFFTLAAAEALKAYPIINATIDGENILYPDHENISISVDTDRGLLTPVIRDTGDLNLAALATRIADVAQRSRDNQLRPDELAGATFTVANSGSLGALSDTPLVFPPQSAVLGTGLVVKRPVVVDVNGTDAIAIRSMAYLTLSYDHRIIDGADAARFLVAVKDRLEDGDFSGNLGL